MTGAEHYNHHAITAFKPSPNVLTASYFEHSASGSSRHFAMVASQCRTGYRKIETETQVTNYHQYIIYDSN